MQSKTTMDRQDHGYNETGNSPCWQELEEPGPHALLGVNIDTATEFLKRDLPQCSPSHLPGHGLQGEGGGWGPLRSAHPAGTFIGFGLSALCPPAGAP